MKFSSTISAQRCKFGLRKFQDQGTGQKMPLPVARMSKLSVQSLVCCVCVSTSCLLHSPEASVCRRRPICRGLASTWGGLSRARHTGDCRQVAQTRPPVILPSPFRQFPARHGCLHFIITALKFDSCVGGSGSLFQFLDIHR